MKKALPRLYAASSLAVVIASAACLEPTQIEMTLRTDVPYAAGRTVAIAVSKTSISDATEPSTTAEEPWGADGKIGSLVLLPSADRDEPVSVRVVMGLGRDPSTCTLADAKGCIFARRRLAFVPHEPLALPVTLYAACEGVPCDEDSTCTALGICVSAQLDPRACAEGQVCEPGVEAPPGNDAATQSSSSGSGQASSSGSSTSSASSSSGSSSGVAPQCDPTDVTVPTSGFFSFGSVNNSATIQSGDPFIITIADGERATFERILDGRNRGCPLHFVMDLSELTIDAVGGQVTLMTVQRTGAPAIDLRATRLSNGNFAVGCSGSSITYEWAAPVNGLLEMVVPLSPNVDTRVRMVVDGVETFVNELGPPPAEPITLILGFGLSDSPSRVGYHSARYFFAP